MTDPIRIVLATNSFKNSISSVEAACAIKVGLEESRLSTECVMFPVADGGDHTLEVVMHHFKGHYSSYSLVADPIGRKVKARFGTILIDQQAVAIIELAEASGLRRLKEDEKDVLRADTFGTGQLIREAIRSGARRVMLGVGGSASTDGGTGILRALGFSLVKANGEEIAPGGQELSLMDDIIYPDELDLSDVSIEVLCDVTNPLTGPEGAAAVFGPQKGASQSDVAILDEGLRNLAAVVHRVTGKDISGLACGGAAGGTAAGLYALLGARLLHGGEKILQLCDFTSALSRAELVVTTEGRFDSQSLKGKAPAVVADAAGRAGVPVVALVGQTEPGLRQDIIQAVLTIGNGHTDLPTALRHTRDDLQRTARQLGNMIAAFRNKQP
jgi:glycerate kinase